MAGQSLKQSSKIINKLKSQMLKLKTTTQNSNLNPSAGGQNHPRSCHPDESQDLTDSESSSE
jgi:hypothetical protein